MQDSPKYYWGLSNITSGNTASVYSSGSIVASATSAAIFVDSMKAASAYFVNPKYTIPPLVMGSGSSVSIQSGNQLLFQNKTDILYKKSENETISFEFWFSFDNSFNGNGYTKNSSSATSYFVNNELKIMQIVTPTGEIGSIKYDYIKNSFIFTMSGTSTQDAVYVLDDLTGTFHIYAYYDQGSLGLLVNGNPGSQGYCYTTFNTAKTAQSVYFVFQPSTLNTATQYFIDDFAVYDYTLSIDQIYNHMQQAFYSNDYNYESLFSQISYFIPQNSEIDLIYSKNHSGSDFLFGLSNFNLNVTENGLGNKYIDPLSLYSPYTSGMTLSASGGTPTASGGAVFSDVGKYLTKNQITLSMQFYKTTASSTNTLFSLTNINGSNSLWANVSNTSYTLYFYDSTSGSSTAILTKSTSPSVGWHNFAFSSDGLNTYMYTDDGTTSSVSYNISFPSYSDLLIGNFNESVSNNTNITFKNVGIFNTKTTNFSTFDFTENKMFMAKLNNNLNISQMGYWKTRIPLTVNPNLLVGTSMDWSSMDNCKVEISKDNGKTWNATYSNSFIYGASANFSASQISSGNIKDYLLKVTLYTDDTVKEPFAKFNNLNYYLYQNLDSYSQDKFYIIKPLYDANGQNSYIRYTQDRKINSRPRNLGIYFQDSSSVTGYAGIYPQDSASAYGLEFWFRANSLNSASNNYILSALGAGPTVYIDKTTKNLIFSSASVYVNGASVATNTTSIALNNIYHILIAFNSVYSASVMYLNGNVGSGGVHTNATYGNIGVWNSLVSADSASTRYLSYISSRTFSIADVSSSTTYIIKNLSADSVKLLKI
jgi:hypothetical protein